jgi:hypothetical protein
VSTIEGVTGRCFVDEDEVWKKEIVDFCLLLLSSKVFAVVGTGEIMGKVRE